MRILVTGASGFIGKRLCCALLERGQEVVSLCRKSIEVESPQLGLYRHIPYVMGETLPRDVVAFSPEALVHLAWDGIPDFSEQMCVENIESHVRFMRQTKSLSQLKKFIGTGTCREYGARLGVCVESDRVPPDGYFSLAKQVLSEYFRISCEERRIALVWFRIFYVYGPGQRAESLIPSLIRSYSSKLNPDVRNPTVANDYVYIDDVVNAIIKAIELPDCHGVINLGSGNTTAVAKIARLVEQLMREHSLVSNRNLPIIDVDEPNAGMWADITLAARQLAWSPQINLVDGINRTIRAAL